MQRRDFLRIGAGLSLGLGAGGLIAASGTYRQETSALESALGSERITQFLDPTQLGQALDAFRSASTGRLMLHYQAFWPMFSHGSPADVVAKLQDLCQPQPQESVPHRRTVFPAVAAAHGLAVPGVPPDEQLALAETILATHLRATNTREGVDRETTVIIWQNLTAALIKSPIGWRSLSITPDLHQQAALVCRLYLDGNRALLHTAVAAWQFLHTYEKALRARGNNAEADTVRTIRESVPSTDLSYRWLRKVGELYETRGHFTQMLPQVSEVVMGYRYTGPVAPELFIAIRLQSAMDDLARLEGRTSHTDMIQARTRERVWGGLEFLANYGFSLRESWPRLRDRIKQEEMPMSEEAVARLGSYSAGSTETMVSELEGLEAKEEARLLGLLTPFRDLTEDAILLLFGKDYSAFDERLARAINKADPPLASVLVEPAHRFITQHPHFTIETKARAHKIVDEEQGATIEALAEVLKERAEFFADPEPKPSISVGIDLAETGVDDPAVHRRETMSGSKSEPTWRFRSYATYRPEELLAIRFGDLEQRNAAIALLWNDPEFRGLPNNSPDGMSLVIPAETVAMFARRGVAFTEHRVRRISDLPPEKMDRARQRNLVS